MKTVSLKLMTPCGDITSVSWSFEPDSLRELAHIIAVEGENPWSYLFLTATSIKKLGWDESFLSQYGTKRETKRFVSQKK